MVTNVSDWDEAMRLVQHCRSNLEERGVPYKTDVPFGIKLSIPAACLTAEDFVKHGCEFFVIGTKRPDPVHPRRRPGGHQRRAYFQPTSKAMYKLIQMAVNAAGPKHPGQHLRPGGGRPRQRGAVPAHGAAQLLDGPQNLLSVKKALLESDALPTARPPGQLSQPNKRSRPDDMRVRLGHIQEICR